MKNIGRIALLSLLFSWGSAFALTHADAAKQIGAQLGIKMNNDRNQLYGLFPEIFPGGYEGREDEPYPNHVTTLEEAVVTLVRWAGWDTVRYDQEKAKLAAPYVSPQGFPYYKPEPTKRSIPYVAVALEKALISPSDLPKLRSQINSNQLANLTKLAKVISENPPEIRPVSPVPDHVDLPTSDQRLMVIRPGFMNYSALSGSTSTIVDLNAPNLRIYNAGSKLSGAKQDYFPLGTLQTTLSVGVYTDKQSLSHQSEAIYGIAENKSSTVNAVGVWGSGSSLANNARVWGGFFTAETPHGNDKDAQVVGLEVDTLNYGKPGKAPNASKSGIQVVGIGTAPVTDAIHVIGAGAAKWYNGIVFAPDAIDPSGAYFGASPSQPVARGIDLHNVRFTDGALLLGQGSAITFDNKAGTRSAILTDEDSRLVIRAAQNGLRIINSESNLDLLTVSPDGDIKTAHGSLADLKNRISKAQEEIDQLKLKNRSPITRFWLPALLCFSILINAVTAIALFRISRTTAPAA